jgi:hypothetical protein
MSNAISRKRLRSDTAIDLNAWLVAHGFEGHAVTIVSDLLPTPPFPAVLYVCTCGESLLREPPEDAPA